MKTRTFLRDKPFLRSLLAYCVGIPVWHVVAVFFGAPFINEIMKTLLFAMLLSAFTFLPLGFVVISEHDLGRLLREFE